MGVGVESRLAGVEDAILAAAGAEVSNLRVVTAAGTDSIVSLTVATNLASESVDAMALRVLDC